MGAGSRGLTVYADYIARHPEKFRLVGVAEPRDFYREETARRHQLSPERRRSDWRELLRHPLLAPAVILATQDRDHLEAGLALMAHGYDLFVEKPMAPHPGTVPGHGGQPATPKADGGGPRAALHPLLHAAETPAGFGGVGTAGQRAPF